MPKPFDFDAPAEDKAYCKKKLKELNRILNEKV